MSSGSRRAALVTWQRHCLPSGEPKHATTTLPRKWREN